MKKQSNDTAPKSGPCAYPGCGTKCNDDNYCYGCGKFVCETHATNPELPWGSHETEQHWEEDEEDDDWGDDG